MKSVFSEAILKSWPGLLFKRLLRKNVVKTTIVYLSQTLLGGLYEKTHVFTRCCGSHNRHGCGCRADKQCLCTYHVQL